MFEIECVAEALDESHRAGAGRPLRVPGLFHQVGGDRPVHNAQHFTHSPPAEWQKETAPQTENCATPGKAKYVLQISFHAMGVGAPALCLLYFGSRYGGGDQCLRS